MFTVPFEHVAQVWVRTVTPLEVLLVVRVVRADALTVHVSDIGKRVESRRPFFALRCKPDLVTTKHRAVERQDVV